MTTAEVFADYLGLTPENAPWAYDSWNCCVCGGHNPEYEPENCPSCDGSGVGCVLTATSPLAPGMDADLWLGALVRHEKFHWLEPCGGAFFAVVLGDRGRTHRKASPHPPHAVALAHIAADPTLREACERAGDYENYKETK